MYLDDRGFDPEHYDEVIFQRMQQLIDGTNGKLLTHNGSYEDLIQQLEDGEKLIAIVPGLPAIYSLNETIYDLHQREPHASKLQYYAVRSKWA